MNSGIFKFFAKEVLFTKIPNNLYKVKKTAKKIFKDL